MSNTLPSVVIVGRPNVGKSTLFNRLTGTRRSIVTDEPGITRDRIYGAAHWEGRAFEVVDTGGIVPGDQEMIPREIFRQAQRAITSAAVLLLVVDARDGVTPLDEELARLLHSTGRPLAIVANKVDTPELAAAAAAFYQLASDVYPVSSEHGLGVDDLLDAVTAQFPAGEAAEQDTAVNVAIIGRPNVGKSTLLNRLVGEERAIVSEVPGTTRDAVDTSVRREGKAYRFVDTAGIRRKGKTKLVAEKLSVIMARRHMERSDVVLLLVDAAQGVTAGDATIAGYAAESGRSVIVVMNKWDLAVKLAREKFERDAQIAATKKPSRDKPGTGEKKKKKYGAERDEKRAVRARFEPAQLLREYQEIVHAKLKFLDYAPVMFLSALTGDRVGQLFELIDRVATARARRVTTGELNRWLAGVDLDRGTSPAARRIKIYYVTQATAAPPTFVLFSNQTRPLHFSYQRFLENQLRASFDFLGTPIFFRQRLKER